MTEIKKKLPIVEGTGGEASVPKTSNKIKAVSMQGVYYYLNTTRTSWKTSTTCPAKILFKSTHLLKLKSLTRKGMHRRHRESKILEQINIRHQ